MKLINDLVKNLTDIETNDENLDKKNQNNN